MVQVRESSTAVEPAALNSPVFMRLIASERMRRPLAILRDYWPALVTLVAMLFAIWVFVKQHMVYRASDFVLLGMHWAKGYHLEALATSPEGYDGQFTYYIARFPGYLPAPFDWSALRYTRMLEPLLVRILSLGNANAMPLVLLALNVTAITATVALVCWLLRERDLPIWLALVPGLYAGQALALERDLTDPLAIFFLAAALVALQKRRWLAVAAFLSFGMLTRESTLIFAVCFAAPLVIERRWKMLAAHAAIVFAPFVVWQTLLYLWLGSWGVHESSIANRIVKLPFHGLVYTHSTHDAVQMIIFAGVPAILAVVFGALALWERPWHDPLRLAAAVGAILYGVALTLQPGVHWLDIWEPLRLAAPLALLLPFIGPRRPLQPVWTVLLLMMIYSFNTALLT